MSSCVRGETKRAGWLRAAVCSARGSLEQGATSLLWRALVYTVLAKGAAVSGLWGCAHCCSPSAVVPQSLPGSDRDTEDPQQTCLCLPTV